jgi:PAS domain S-box-containing protein
MQAQDQILQAIFDQAAVGIAQISLDGTWLRVNKRYCQMLGYSEAELRSKTLKDFTHPDDCAEVLDARRQLLEGTISLHSMEKRYIRRDGTVFWGKLNRSLVRNDENLPQYFIAVVEDITEKKLAERALMESEQRFRNMADAAPVMIWVSGPDKRCTFFNKPWLDFRGRSMEQELGKGCLEGIHPDDQDRSLAIYHSAFGARRPFQKECRLQRADGEYRWVLDNGRPVYRDGEFAGFIGSCIDITEQKLAEERLRANEVQLKDALRLTKVGSWEFHIEDATSCWSDENRRILGVPDDAPANLLTFITCVHPKDREKVLESARTIGSTGETGELEYRIIRPDGEVRFVHSVFEALRNDQGMAVRIVGATQDITDQITATKLLHESEERLKNAERLAHLGHWQWDLKSNHVSWSEEMFRIFGKAPDYLPTYDGVIEAIVPEDKARIERYVRDRLGERIQSSTEFRIIRPDGDLRTVTAVFEVSRNQEGQLASLFGACQDVTEVRRAQQESVARQKLESVGTLASGIAHDFNNLMGGVLAESELALAELAGGLHPEEELKAIRDVALRGSEIVRQLMVYAGKESVVVGLVDLSRVVKEMIELLKVSVSKHAVLETDLGKDLPAIQADAAQLRQIVMNLVTNASDAIGDRDGVIHVTTSHVRPDQDSPGVVSRPTEIDYVQLVVSDSGRGMSPGVQVRVFDPFFTTKSAGHGLGLAIVDGIVRSLHGKIDLTSEPGKGTAVKISLPCGGITAVPDPRPPVEEAAQFSNPATVLVVEDEEILRRAAAKALRTMGFAVLEASNGSAAVDVLRASGNRVDVILLDMTIPGPPIHEIVAEYARVRPDAKVILTSAYSEEMARATLSVPQVRGFIRKPFHLADVARKIRSTLSS